MLSPAPIFEEGAKKYLSELTKQTDYTKALDTSKIAPGVAQQNALAQAAQQQAMGSQMAGQQGEAMQKEVQNDQFASPDEGIQQGGL